MALATLADGEDVGPAIEIPWLGQVEVTAGIAVVVGGR